MGPTAGDLRKVYADAGSALVIHPRASKITDSFILVIFVGARFLKLKQTVYFMCENECLPAYNQNDLLPFLNAQIIVKFTFNLIWGSNKLQSDKITK
jgi:hypothetical protein